MTLISVQNVGKSFRTYRSEWQRFAGWAGISVKPSEEHHVLHQITFDIKAGEAIGIIGQNGAGKSTLLKIITGTLQPTAGRVLVNGRIAAILELGMGFNPELTGRQNVVHAAGLMGFSAAQIQRAIPEIEAFAEIGDYFDEPIRTYSSGMQMRIAFSVATAYRPEILIVDEALSVGDAYFQHKCFERLKSYRKEGCGLLFVSHDTNAIKNICNRSILLVDGTVVFDGHPDDAFDYYNALLAQQHPKTFPTGQNSSSSQSQGTRSGSGEIRITSVELLSSDSSSSVIDQGGPAVIKVAVSAMSNVEQWCVGIVIRDRFGNDIFGTNTTLLNLDLPPLSKNDNFVVEFTIPEILIGPGTYSISAAIHDLETHVTGCFDWWDKAVIFEISTAPGARSVGVCRMPIDCSILRAS